MVVAYDQDQDTVGWEDGHTIDLGNVLDDPPRSSAEPFGLVRYCGPRGISDGGWSPSRCYFLVGVVLQAGLALKNRYIFMRLVTSCDAYR